MASVSGQAGHEILTRSREMVGAMCREIDPRVQVTVHEALHVTLSLGGHERYIEMRLDHLHSVEQARDWLRREITAAIEALRQAAPAMAAPTQVGTSSEPVPPQPTSDQVIRPADREALDQVMGLARHMIAMIEPQATLSFEEYVWHGDPTLDITVSLHGQERHLEVTAARARIILPDYEWELRNQNLQDELLYHELEEIVHDLHRP